MTAPVQEPTESRQLGTLGWGDRQLRRRPSPPTGSGPVCLRALRDYGTGLVVATATETPVTFDEWENEDNTIFEENLDISLDLQKVSFKAQGVYTVTCTIKWETEFDGVTEVCWLDDSGTTGNWPFGQTGNMGQFGSGRTANSFNYPLTLSITKKYPLLGITPGDVVGADYGNLFLKVMQRSGTNKDLTFVTLDIFYWGATQTSI